MFLDTFMLLCKQRGVSPNKACIDIGLSRTAVAKWKSGGTPNGTTLTKIAEYFGVSVDYLMRNDQQNVDQELDGVDFALYGEVKEMTADEKQDILDYIRFKKAQKESKK